jgi:sugar-specific transcriptional regulator TrmB
MLEDIKSGLLDLGLTDKEAEVYLAMLELGPSSVQDIAKRAGVNRSTTYVMIEGLKKHGLVSMFEKGKKIVFAAENPEKLMAIVSEHMGLLEAKRDRLSQTLPRLMAIFNAVEDKPRVRFFEGDAGLIGIREEIAESKEAIWELYAVDEMLMDLVSVEPERRIERSKILHGRALISVKPGFEVPFFDINDFEVREIDYKKLPFTGDLAIVGSRVYILSHRSRGLGVIIDSADIAEVMKALYEMAWSCALPWTPPPDWGKQKTT